MTVNIPKIERALRVTLGVLLVSLAFFGPENMWFLVGLIPLITGTVGVCPIKKVVK